MNVDLAKEVWSEEGIMELLGCTKKQLRQLTLEGSLPAIRLQRGFYVYLAEDVRKWLADRRTGSGAFVTERENDVTTP